MPSKRVKVEIAVSPRFDIFYALYALGDPSPSAADQWKSRATRELPKDFENLVQRIAPRPIFWALLADALRDSHGELSFEEMVAALAGLSPADLRANILAGIFHDPAIVQSLANGKKNVRQIAEGGDTGVENLLTHFGLRPYEARSPSARTISTLISDPASFRDGLLAALRQFWETSFRSEWSALEGELRTDSRRMRGLAAELPTEELARELRLPVAFDLQAREVRPKHGPAIPYELIDRCYVLPSAFNTRRWWAKYEAKNGRVNLYFPVVRTGPASDTAHQERSRTLPASREPGSIRAELVFRALGDTTRYAIATLLARAPTTSAELARNLGVSKPTITHHVQALRAAGLIDDRPFGGSAKLSLNRATVAALSQAAVDQLFSGHGDLALATTRKRRAPENLKND
jgi:DNA-binding transcriptional ArsR family regulator